MIEIIRIAALSYPPCIFEKLVFLYLHMYLYSKDNTANNMVFKVFRRMQFVSTFVPTTLMSLPPGLMFHMLLLKDSTTDIKKKHTERCAKREWPNRSVVKRGKAKIPCNVELAFFGWGGKRPPPQNCALDPLANSWSYFFLQSSAIIQNGVHIFWQRERLQIYAIDFHATGADILENIMTLVMELYMENLKSCIAKDKLIQYLLQFLLAVCKIQAVVCILHVVDSDAIYFFSTTITVIECFVKYCFHI